MKFNSGLLCAAFLVSEFVGPGLGLAQQDSPVDLVPLKVGLVSTYAFRGESREGFAQWMQTREGTAVYKVVSSRSSPDSIKWTMVRTRDFLRINYSHQAPQFPFETVRDTSSFEVVELTNGYHELVVPSAYPSSAPAGSDAFAFWNPQIDTVRVYRFGSASAESIVVDGTYRAVNYVAHRSVTLKKDSGVTHSTGYTSNVMLSSNLSWDFWLTDVKGVNEPQPAQPVLHQNFPNPFNPSTAIRFDLPTAGHATLRVYDLLGRNVATLTDEDLSAGSYTRVFGGRAYASGVYICRLELNEYSHSIKLLLVR